MIVICWETKLNFATKNFLGSLICANGKKLLVEPLELTGSSDLNTSHGVSVEIEIRKII